MILPQKFIIKVSYREELILPANTLYAHNKGSTNILISSLLSHNFYFVGSQLDWTSRFRVILGIAHGIHYLHDQHVLHLDVKPANILLDSNMNPKITNFRTAKTLNEMITLTDNIEGTV